MALRVQKFGGTSVADIERISKVADRVQKAHENKDQMVVVLSAMAGVTNSLISLAGQASKAPDKRELDVLLATGEQTTAALMAMMLKSRGLKAKSFLGFQAGIHTDHMSGKARIRDIDSQNLRDALDEGNIVVVAGFQGADDHGDITTLGRGGSDTSAVAIAASLKADVCEIFTDVDGVYTTDPRICPKARKISRISYDEMLEMAILGAKVLQIRSVEFAKKYNVPVHVRSSFNEEEGTMVVNESKDMESPVVSGVTCDMNEARITFKRVPDQPGISAKVFGALAEAGISVDMIIQNSRTGGETDLTFTVTMDDFERATEISEKVADQIHAGEIKTATEIAKISVIGIGMKSHSGVAAVMFKALAEENINIRMISTSEIRISCVILSKYAELAVRTLHTAFGLDND
ncbi:aspartate kinase [Desulfobacter hydrogenophilus]|uniref:Aspartokinase n=1 Tax=Desulfobacter hydrogenophilus TaxID=2291 RepID=A0A328FB73_9BACT|nr:aspartate kinase [Desulfobacter hydrogenophilus]NDY72376.1 aspartate kinase [Desulfobacter hydrogenophilus]QBH13102.1 aspartate kinase [Desulfobacter hydrogenophilus]RAM01808.1 aspartate kinase [Desulfobacter hydrogenophilus]